MHPLRSFVGLVLLAIATRVGAQRPPAAESERVGGVPAPSDEQAIRRLLAEYDASWSAHDPQRRDRLFAQDAYIVNVTGTVARGPAGAAAIGASPLFQRLYADAIQQFDSMRSVVRIRKIALSVSRRSRARVVRRAGLTRRGA